MLFDRFLGLLLVLVPFLRGWRVGVRASRSADPTSATLSAVFGYCSDTRTKLRSSIHFVHRQLALATISNVSPSEASALHALLHFFGRHLFDTAGNPPDVSCRILHCSGPVAVELGCRFLLRGSASLQTSPIGLVHVLNVDVQLARYRIILSGC